MTNGERPRRRRADPALSRDKPQPVRKPETERRIRERSERRERESQPAFVREGAPLETPQQLVERRQREIIAGSSGGGSTPISRPEPQTTALIDRVEQPGRGSVTEQERQDFNRVIAGFNQRRRQEEIRQRVRAERGSPPTPSQPPRRFVTAAPSPPPNAFQRFVGSVQRSFSGQSNVTGQTLGQQLRTGGVSETAGGLLGLTGGIAAFGAGGSAGIRGAGAATRTVQASRFGQLGTRVLQTRPGVIGTTIGATAGLGLASTEVTRTALRSQETPFERQQFRRPAIQQAFSAGERAFEQDISRGGVTIPFTNQQFSVQRLAIEALPLQTVVGDQSAFTRGFQQNLRSQGFLEADINRLTGFAIRERQRGATAETVGLLTASAATEVGGRAAFTQAFQRLQPVGQRQVFGQLFRTGFGITAPLGVGEGVTQELIQSRTRARPVDPLRLGVVGGVSGLFAGTLGGFIPATAATRPTVSRAAAFAANIADPFELPGDIVASGARRFASGVTGRTFRVPAISIPSDTSVSFTTAPEGGRGRRGGTTLQGIPPFNGVPSLSITPTPTPTSTRQSNIITPAIIPEPVLTPTPTDVISPSITPVPVPIGVRTNVRTNIPVQNLENLVNNNININQPVTTSTPTLTPTTIPTFTPILRAPPPFVPLFPDLSGLGGGSGRRRGRSSRFINELQVGQDLIRNLLGGAQPRRRTRRRPRR